MTAPAVVARTEATGIKLRDGFASNIAFESNANVSFWEKTVQPPGVDGGDAIDTTTMFNAAYRTSAARSLASLTDAAVTAAYDPLVVSEILSLVNDDTGSITIHWPEGSTLAFWGFLKSIEFAELVEGTQPECSVVIVATNWDPAANQEEGPVYTDVAGS
ncbi:hypothetical protein LCGC14_0909050 [marine sediment metagenome]|uniref:Uncharacterized protein n=1 Tax=marine sediment metagenome TaxID=412755 RepID=A0A0F9NYU3_9ZZZZ